LLDDDGRDERHVVGLDQLGVFLLIDLVDFDLVVGDACGLQRGEEVRKGRPTVSTPVGSPDSIRDLADGGFDGVYRLAVCLGVPRRVRFSRLHGPRLSFEGVNGMG
jgi:hypothetical protein